MHLLKSNTAKFRKYYEYEINVADNASISKNFCIKTFLNLTATLSAFEKKSGNH